MSSHLGYTPPDVDAIISMLLLKTQKLKELRKLAKVTQLQALELRLELESLRPQSLGVCPTISHMQTQVRELAGDAALFEQVIEPR